MTRNKHLTKSRLVFIVVSVAVLLMLIELVFMVASEYLELDGYFESVPHAVVDGGIMGVAAFAVCWFLMGRPMQRLIDELHQALDEVKTLRGIIPICATCKQIRDDEGSWNQLEKYISEHSGADFSHGICPACAQKELDKMDNDGV